jgi:hypothetical protein
VDIFKELGVEGFSFGKKFFSGRNENVIMGDKLCDKLLETVGKEAQDIIKETEYIYEIIEKYEKIKKEFYE